MNLRMMMEMHLWTSFKTFSLGRISHTIRMSSLLGFCKLKWSDVEERVPPLCGTRRGEASRVLPRGLETEHGERTQPTVRQRGVVLAQINVKTMDRNEDDEGRGLDIHAVCRDSSTDPITRSRSTSFRFST